MDSFESLLIRRRQEIEVELMKLEVDAWAAVGKEQQVPVTDRQRKLDSLAAEVHRARLSYREVAAAVVDGLQVVSAKVSAPPRPRRFGRKEQQTLTEADVPTISDDAGLQREAELAREEVEALQKVVELHDDQVRLSKEPVEGKTFAGIRESRSYEDAALDEVAKKIANLEKELTEAEQISEDVLVFTSEDPGEWIPDTTRTEAPWDEDDIEAVAVQAEPSQTLRRPAGAQTGVFPGALHPTGVQALTPYVALQPAVAQAGAAQHRPPGIQRGVFLSRPRPPGVQTEWLLGVVRPTVTLPATPQHVFRPTGLQAGATQGVLRPAGVQAGVTQGVLRPAGVQAGVTQGVLRPTGVQAGVTQGVLRPAGVQAGVTQGVLRPAGVQAGVTQGVLRPTGVQAGVTQGVLRPTGVQAGATQGAIRPTGVQAGVTQGVLRPTGATQGVLRPTGVQAGAQGVLRPAGVQAGAQGVLRPTGVQAGAQGVLRPAGVQAGVTQGVLHPTGVQAGVIQGVLRPTGVQDGAQGVLRPAGVQAGAQGVLRPAGVQAGVTQGVLRPTGVQPGVSQGKAFPTRVIAERAAAPGLAGDSPFQTRSQPAAQPCQPDSLLVEFQEDMGMSWPASQPTAHGAASSTSKAKFIPKKPFLSRFQSKN
ncbi:uncharacterized protein LOC117641856 [Thrips palmi]|uniref:Uncharacterized protein LOC117641856 n=1 Tax=Thrips palmi TaxID=161013 RepID=A0A6P8YN24_THRPL|nr:uncharacterized protein LOC117641856 [Thrips palmi]XP_034235447.1 uncharacterized protein LOC117641856 [Thrips palmi]